MPRFAHMFGGCWDNSIAAAWSYDDAASQCSLHAYIATAALQDGGPLVYSLPIVLGRRTGVPRAQRLCQRCNLHVLHDERHLVIECPAMQCVQDRYAALFMQRCSCGSMTLWGRHTPSWIILGCLVPLRVLLMMHHPHFHQTWRLLTCNPIFRSSSRVTKIPVLFSPFLRCTKKRQKCCRAMNAVHSSHMPEANVAEEGGK